MPDKAVRGYLLQRKIKENVMLDLFPKRGAVFMLE